MLKKLKFLIIGYGVRVPHLQTHSLIEGQRGSQHDHQVDPLPASQWGEGWCYGAPGGYRQNKTFIFTFIYYKYYEEFHNHFKQQ